jgi:predicted ATPase
MISSVHFSGYRSLFDFRLRLGPVTVLRGPNGTGKTNVYRALRLLSALAQDRFGEAVAQEGGMNSLLWCGTEKAKRLTVMTCEVMTDTYKYEVKCGLRPCGPDDPTAFRLDPDIKSETLHCGKRLAARRTKGRFSLADARGVMQAQDQTIHSSVSMLTAVRDLQNHPLQLAACLDMQRWRFYHAMRTDERAPARLPMRGYWSPVLAEDGRNLPAVVQSIRESMLREPFDRALATAFPGASLDIETGDQFSLSWSGESLPRAFNGHELSDGTLQFICLAAALCSPQPPPLLVLNEPETSLSEALFPALADLIIRASEHSQLLIVSHAPGLCDAIAERGQTRVQDLSMYFGETRMKGHDSVRSRIVFDDSDD